jgi:hypothetical protein
MGRFDFLKYFHTVIRFHWRHPPKTAWVIPAKKNQVSPQGIKNPNRVYRLIADTSVNNLATSVVVGN